MCGGSLERMSRIQKELADQPSGNHPWNLFLRKMTSRIRPGRQAGITQLSTGERDREARGTGCTKN